MAELFIGDIVSETEEIHRSRDGKLRLHLGLYRKGTSESLWIKYVHKGFLNTSTFAYQLRDDSFQSFVDFLTTAIQTSRIKRALPANCRSLPA